jgi:rfaE bifunctional protein kinase chain/domain
MNVDRFMELSERYGELRIAVVGDYCLDRYLEIDPGKGETSLETGLPVHNVVRVRAQPGGAGTIVNNLSALGVGEVHVVGFCGVDGEGFELVEQLRQTAGVQTGSFLRTDARCTFTYCKPLVLEVGKPPRELNRLDTKNWTPTPPGVQQEIAVRLEELAPSLDALILLDQVNLPETGVVTRMIRDKVAGFRREHPGTWVFADSRRGLADYPPFCFKMNRSEFHALLGLPGTLDLAGIQREAGKLAGRNQQHVFVTLAEDGIVGAAPDGETCFLEALPVRGPIDIVGAGDCVTANLTAALAAGASLEEALLIARAASSIVIHQLGTTGTASPAEIASLLERESPS